MNRKRHIFPAFYFYPRPPRGGRRSRWSRGRGCRNFYPRPPRGGRQEFSSKWNVLSQFLSTPSARRATTRTLAACGLDRYFYPRPPRGGRLLVSVVDDHHRRISIHALREEGDQHLLSCTLQHVIFLSTPSARRATSVLDTSVTATVFLSTPSARRATLRRALPDDLRRGISIHALREEGDKPTVNGTRHTDRFLSTPSARRATVGNDAQAQDIEISIHALREEGDVIFCFNSASAC